MSGFGAALPACAAANGNSIAANNANRQMRARALVSERMEQSGMVLAMVGS